LTPRLLDSSTCASSPRRSRLPSWLSARESLLLRAFADRLREREGANLVDLRLFGSRARGEGHERSDLDVLVVVRELDRARKVAIWDLAFDVGLGAGVRAGLAPFVRSERHWGELVRLERRIAREIVRDGVSL